MDNNIINFNEDDIILTENESTPNMFYVLSGAVTLYHNYGSKNELLLGICGKGKVFNEVGLINNGSSLYTAVAYSDVTLVKITEDNFINFIEEYPQKVMDMLRHMTKINEMLMRNVELLINELDQSILAKERNDQLRANIARYAVRGINAYTKTIQTLTSPDNTFL